MFSEFGAGDFMKWCDYFAKVKQWFEIGNSFYKNDNILTIFCMEEFFPSDSVTTYLLHYSYKIALASMFKMNQYNYITLTIILYNIAYVYSFAPNSTRSGVFDITTI